VSSLVDGDSFGAFGTKGHRMHIRSLIAAALIALTIPSFSQPIATFAATKATPAPIQGDLQLFSTESGAQKHCPNDQVVWLNTASGIYHEKGMRWYGNTKHGAYVCRKEADGAGDRDTRNGQ
jgi:hypothetical protein